MKEYLLIDACQFGANYNYCLLDSLSRKGEKVVYATTEYAHDHIPDPPEVKVLKCFFLLTRIFKGAASFGYVRRFLRAIEYPADLIFLIAYVLVRRIKIIHFIWIVSPQLDYSVMKFLQFMGCNVIYTAHNPFPHERGDEHIKKYARIYQTVDHIIALTEYTKQKIVECAGVGEVKISVIPHGDYAPLFSTYKINDDLVGALKKKAAGRKVISFLGLIRPYKGLDFFIEAIDLIKMEMPNSFFVIAGASLITDKEKLRRRLETPITNNDLWADIRFIPNENFVAYLSVTDVLVQPYLNASQSGNTVMAYSAGIPVVSTDVGGLAEMTADDKTGYIVPPGNSAAIAEAVIKCFSRDNYQRLSDNARKAATEKYGWSKIADQTLSIYRNLENRDARA